jgi:UDP-glucose 4-epimerase
VFAHLAQPGATHFYNLGPGTPTSVREVIQAVERVTGLKVPVKFGERRAGDPPALYANSTKVQAELGWKPKFMSIESIVATAWRWHSRRPNGYGDR